MVNASTQSEAGDKQHSDCLHVENAALRLIARAEQCAGGLSRKLKKRGYDKYSVNSVIEKLCDLQLIDDNRFARLWLESRLHLTRSPKRLLISLCARGIDRDDAEAALRNVLDADVENALLVRFAKKYARKFKSEDSRSLKYFLRSEGFSSGAICEYLDGEL
ncbi:MAG: recombination regulator RecX [Treponema sp.]|nr:recombination regulator RecX [Treponema sp.]